MSESDSVAKSSVAGDLWRETARMGFNDWRLQTLPSLGSGDWITVFCSQSGPDRYELFCGLISAAKARRFMEDPSWDIHPEPRPPSLIEDPDGDTFYDRFGGRASDVESLVIVRDFGGFAPPAMEIAEDFRLFHNLTFDAQRSTFVAFDELGHPEDVVIIQPGEIQVRSYRLQHYLSVRSMALLLYFERRRHAPYSVDQLGLDGSELNIAEDNLRYHFNIFDDLDSPGCLSILYGKKLLFDTPAPLMTGDPFAQFADFLVRPSPDYAPRYSTCDPKLLPGGGGVSGGPHYLDIAFFNAQVLRRYLDRPDAFTVKTRSVCAGHDWMLLMSIRKPNYVIVHLGDLGSGLPYHEQLHWRKFNVPPPPLDSLPPA